ncbi:MAG: SpoIID/LytB domain-containing protein [Ruminococcaceae bacterium]|nr:SpoIID/LytB domain-containing protein [Oscillospiraceae bacterium]
MRKLLILLCMAMLTLLPVLSYAALPQSDTIKIGLFYGSAAKAEVTLTSGIGFDIGFEREGEFTSLIKHTQSTVKVCIQEGKIIPDLPVEIPQDGILTIYPMSGTLTIEGTEYRGAAQFLPAESGMTVINLVDIEEYLYGVVGREMSPSWNVEALKAQAVCARGFVYTNWNKFASYGFNLDNTTKSQVYAGVSAEKGNVKQAVDETRGMVLTYEGKTAQTFYFATDGGATADVSHVWGSDIPYLKGRKDDNENPDKATRYQWEITLTPDEVKQCLANYGADVGEPTAITAVTTDELGYVTELTVSGTKGDYTVKNSKCRDLFGQKIYSQRYTVSGGATPTDTRYIRRSGGLEAFDLAGTYVLSASGTTYIPPKGDGNFVFSGNGWGHGVGMSQYGALGMAENGHTYEEILAFYFPGTTLTEY